MSIPAVGDRVPVERGAATGSDIDRDIGLDTLEKAGRPCLTNHPVAPESTPSWSPPPDRQSR